MSRLCTLSVRYDDITGVLIDAASVLNFRQERTKSGLWDYRESRAGRWSKECCKAIAES